MKRLTFLDVAITIFFFILIIFIVFYYVSNKSSSSSILLVETEGEQYYYSLDQEKRVAIKGAVGDTIIEINNGKFRFVESACPNKDCVAMGWVSLYNYPVICLPNKVSAYIVNNKNKPEFDGISR